MGPTCGCTAAPSTLSANSAMQAHAASRLSVLPERACLTQNATTYATPHHALSLCLSTGCLSALFMRSMDTLLWEYDTLRVKDSSVPH